MRKIVSGNAIFNKNIHNLSSVLSGKTSKKYSLFFIPVG